MASLCIRGTPVPPSSSPSGPWPSANTSSTWTASRARSVSLTRHTHFKAHGPQAYLEMYARGLQWNCFMSYLEEFSVFLSVQSKIHAARSLSEIAIDLTETGTLKTSKLANMGSKGKIISGSSGSLLSSGQCIEYTCVCVCVRVHVFMGGKDDVCVSLCVWGGVNGQRGREEYRYVSVFVVAYVVMRGSLVDNWRDRNSCFWKEASESLLNVLTRLLYTNPHPPTHRLSVCTTPTAPCHTDSSSRGPGPL